MKINTKKDRRVRIQLRQRKRITGTKERPRLSVFRSVSHIYAQVIDDMNGRTLVAASTIDPSLKASFDKKVKGGTRVVFDRSGFLYHGRIRAVADAARKAGLEF
jgi:large subunit ribosomal protein L18